MPEDIFTLVVRSREGLLYQGKVASLSSVNEKGKFDVLAQHANFISLVKDHLNIGEVDGKTKELKIDNALMRVMHNNVEVYVGVEGFGPEEMTS